MNHPSNENIPSRSFSYHAFNFTFLLLLAVFFISLYTVALLKSNSRITLSAAVERNISCSDAVHRAISSRLTRADFEQINTKSDMNSAQYRSLQSYLNELRSLNSTRYLYTAKRGPGGKPIYLIDGLDLEAPDFAYPGTYLEEEMVPYLEAALSGKTIHSQKIIDTTWGHIFTACYPVIASDGTNDILGALCIEIDMEDTYRSIEAINRSSFGIAAAASMIALLLIVISYFYTKKQKSRELTQQQLLEQTAKAAEAANKAKSTFLFNMSHDIRSSVMQNLPETICRNRKKSVNIWTRSIFPVKRCSLSSTIFFSFHRLRITRYTLKKPPSRLRKVLIPVSSWFRLPWKKNSSIFM